MTPTATATDLRLLPVKSLRASLGAMASRGETTGPRVDATRAALEWRRNRALLVERIGMSPDAAEDLLDQMTESGDDAQAEASVAP